MHIREKQIEIQNWNIAKYTETKVGNVAKSGKNDFINFEHKPVTIYHAKLPAVSLIREIWQTNATLNKLINISN